MVVFAPRTPGPFRIPARAQSDSSAQPDSNAARPLSPERRSLFYQATAIGSARRGFYAACSGPLSLSSRPEYDVPLTTTLFFARALPHNTPFVFNPEIAGRGFSGVNGLANQYDGELPPIGTATPKPCMAGLLVAHDFRSGDREEQVDPGPDVTAGDRPASHNAIVIGRFALTDCFDESDYPQDPRTRFMGWAVMYNCAWDYPAGPGGYAWGRVRELHFGSWSLRCAGALAPKVVNGLRFGRRVLRGRGDAYEGEIHYAPWPYPGVLRLPVYANFTDSGGYGEALQLAAAADATPNVFATNKVGRLRYRFGVNLRPEIRDWFGVFMRPGWSDGRSQASAFTAIDRVVRAGISIRGARPGRPDDTVGSAFPASSLSAVHALCPAHGGRGFMIGDGACRTAPATRRPAGATLRACVHAHHCANPAYNEARGPLRALSLRLYAEIGKDK